VEVRQECYIIRRSWNSDNCSSWNSRSYNSLRYSYSNDWNAKTTCTGTVSTLGNLGVTATAAQLNYTTGVTSAIQTQLNTKTTCTGTVSTLGNLGVTATAAQLNYTNWSNKRYPNTVKHQDNMHRYHFIGCSWYRSNRWRINWKCYIIRRWWIWNNSI
jgi:hypothetical protein